MGKDSRSRDPIFDTTHRITDLSGQRLTTAQVLKPSRDSTFLPSDKDSKLPHGSH